RPGQVRWGLASPEFTVDEVADPAEREAYRHRRDEEVRHLQKGAPHAPAIDGHTKDDTNGATVEAHAAVPDLDGVKRILQVVQGLVEQHVAEPSADQNASDR